MGNITPYEGKTPLVHRGAFVDVSARIIGEVIVEEGVTIWPMAVLRADSAAIHIGRRSAILDHAVIEAPEGCPARIEGGSLISHGAIIHGALIHTNTLIGIGAIVLDGAIISKGSIVGAGSVVTARTTIPPNSLVVGIPGRVIRETTEKERKEIRRELKDLYRKSRAYIR
jgi:carbonic anhydrase/acetyltransferase-like protein (isoleucine patch superfamily)